jgi:hypothetical protein
MWIMIGGGLGLVERFASSSACARRRAFPKENDGLKPGRFSIALPPLAKADESRRIGRPQISRVCGLSDKGDNQFAGQTCAANLD